MTVSAMPCPIFSLGFVFRAMHAEYFLARNSFIRKPVCRLVLNLHRQVLSENNQNILFSSQELQKKASRLICSFLIMGSATF